jgi:hypothetical protein
MDLVALNSLRPDLVIFDREENNEIMAQQCPFPWIDTHVVSIFSMAPELQRLGEKLQAPKLFELADRWQRILKSKPSVLSEPPALLEWHRREKAGEEVGDGPNVYVIWAHPWMAASANTFIGSVCEWLGWSLWSGSVKYPQFQPKDFSNARFLCSSEPYPFFKKRNVLAELPGEVALVDGEKLSWFGLRSLLYLESVVHPRETTTT